MGLSGRQASRNALAKMNGSTPAGSRAGTPVPEGSQGNGAEEDEEDEKVKGSGAVRKKVLKKGLGKLKKEGSGKHGTATANGKVGKRPPSSTVGGDSGKRDLEEMLVGEDGEEEDNVHVKKRQKLQRVESTASFNSQSTAAVEMERAESHEGSSFIDEDLVNFDDD